MVKACTSRGFPGRAAISTGGDIFPACVIGAAIITGGDILRVCVFRLDVADCEFQCNIHVNQCCSPVDITIMIFYKCDIFLVQLVVDNILVLSNHSVIDKLI